MSELLAQGELLPVAVVAKNVTGRRPSRPTIWRWLRAGVSGGVTLEAVLARGWLTTEAAFRDFMSRRAQAMLLPKPTVPPATDDSLKAAGLL